MVLIVQSGFLVPRERSDVKSRWARGRDEVVVVLLIGRGRGSRGRRKVRRRRVGCS